MLTVAGIVPGSPARKAGIQPGDILESLNDWPVRDCVDLSFYSADLELEAVLLREKARLTRLIRNPRSGNIGIIPEEMTIARCNNRCLFCFVDQMPRGLRKTLYIKDEDFRLSFLDGAYICATNLSEEDFKRIGGQGLSPLYVSVHATSETVRKHLLRNPSAPPILPVLRRLADAGIDFHTQIVLCPGINDGPVLMQTIRDLDELHPHTLSIAVVPVGLTRHRSRLPAVRPVDSAYAGRLLRSLEPLQRRLQKKHSRNLLFFADEWYLKAGAALPALPHYHDFPQIDNGVGMMRAFIQEFRTFLKARRPAKRAKRLGIITGFSAYKDICSLFKAYERKTKNACIVIRVENRLMGPSVTVTGLLSGEDIVRAAFPLLTEFDLLCLPPNCINADGLTLDGLTIADMSKRLHKPVRVVRELKELP